MSEDLSPVKMLFKDETDQSTKYFFFQISTGKYALLIHVVHTARMQIKPCSNEKNRHNYHVPTLFRVDIKTPK